MKGIPGTAIMIAMRNVMKNLRFGWVRRFPLVVFQCVGSLCLSFLPLASPLIAQRAERPALNITGYVIDAEIDTSTHHLAAKTQVTFTAPDNMELVPFGFHPALKVNKITDENGKVLTGERSADGTIRVTPATPFTKGQ